MSFEPCLATSARVAFALVLIVGATASVPSCEHIAVVDVDVQVAQYIEGLYTRNGSFNGADYFYRVIQLAQGTDVLYLFQSSTGWDIGNTLDVASPTAAAFVFTNSSHPSLINDNWAVSDGAGFVFSQTMAVECACDRVVLGGRFTSPDAINGFYDLAGFFLSRPYYTHRLVAMYLYYLPSVNAWIVNDVLGQAQAFAALISDVVRPIDSGNWLVSEPSGLQTDANVFSSCGNFSCVGEDGYTPGTPCPPTFCLPFVLGGINVTCPQNNSIGAECSISCPAGYQSGGLTGTYSCAPTGSFVATSPCLASCSPSISDVGFAQSACSTNSTIAAESAPPCTVSCLPGHVGTAAEYLCRGAGDWLGDRPLCVAWHYAGFPGSKVVETTAGAPLSPIVFNATGQGAVVISDPDKQLPAGLYIQGGNVLTGTVIPVDANVTQYNVSLMASDNVQSVRLPNMTFRVYPAMSLQSLELLLVGGVFFETRLASIAGGKQPIVYRLLDNSSLPQGIRFRSDGLISGIPRHGGAQSLVAVLHTIAIDATGAIIGLPPLIMTIQPTMQIVNLENLTNTIRSTVSRSSFLAVDAPGFEVVGGQAPYVFAINNDALLRQLGLRFDVTNGEIGGRPQFFSSEDAPNKVYPGFQLLLRDAVGSERVLRSFAIEISQASDCDDPANGPGGQSCNGGECLDETPFDLIFACLCPDPTDTDPNCSLSQPSSSGADVSTILGAVFGVILCLLLIALAVLYRRMINERNKPIDFAKMVQELIEAGAVREKEDQRLPTELPRAKLRLIEQLGEGSFGTVHRATISEIGGRDVPEFPVAVKILKNTAREDEETALYREAALMAQFDHPNVVGLVGVCTKGRPKMLVVQLCENGSLESFLKRMAHFGGLGTPACLHMALDVAKGMSYLSDERFVHRDLASRNVLLSNDFICKIADFGLSLDLGDNDVYVSTHFTRLPFRWAAPECLKQNEFSSASDVWSFGIVLHELFSGAELPYKSFSGKTAMADILKFITDGNRISQWRDCPDHVYDIALDCWRLDPMERPTFSHIVERIESSLRVVGDDGVGSREDLRRMSSTVRQHSLEVPPGWSQSRSKSSDSPLRLRRASRIHVSAAEHADQSNHDLPMLIVPSSSTLLARDEPAEYVELLEAPGEDTTKSNSLASAILPGTANNSQESVFATDRDASELHDSSSISETDI